MKNQIEREIEELLQTEMQATTFSALLFGPDGLFGLLAHTAPEREVVSRSPLFQRALARLDELTKAEAAPFLAEAERIRAAMARGAAAAQSRPAQPAPTPSPTPTGEPSKVP